MKKLIMVTGFLACLLPLLMTGGTIQAENLTKQEELLASCQKLQRFLTLPPEMSTQQQALVALNVAIAQSLPIDESLDLGELLRQTRSLTTYLVKSDTFFLWESAHWEPTHRSTFGYSGTRLTSIVQQTWDGVSWTNSSQSLTTYNGDGTINTVTDQDWLTDHWVNSSLSTFTYSGGQLITTLDQNWSGSAWVNYSRVTLTYSAGKVATSISETWQTSAWVNSNKTTYTYVGTNLTEWILQSWETSAWVNHVRQTSTYNGSGDETQSITYSWQTSAWVNAGKSDYSYDGSHNEILDLTSIWSGASWIAMEADTTKWSSGHHVEIVYNRIIPPSVSRSQFSYDGNGNETQALGQDWSGGVWVNVDRGVFVYEAALAVEVGNGLIPSIFELSQNYPNPFNPSTVIRYSLSRRALVEVTVFNVLGQEVKVLENGLQPAGVYETTWDGTSKTGEKVASGIYFYRIRAGENVETRKMLLLK